LRQIARRLDDIKAQGGLTMRGTRKTLSDSADIQLTVALKRRRFNAAPHLGCSNPRGVELLVPKEGNRKQGQLNAELFLVEHGALWYFGPCRIGVRSG
jgi:hypothetical protein